LQLPYRLQLIAWHWPDGLARGVWIFGFAMLYLLGAGIATWKQRKDHAAAPFFVFVWAFFLAGVIPGTCFYIFGDNQIYFVWYGLVALASIAGYGLFTLGASLARRPRVFGIVLGAIALIYAFAPGIAPGQPTGYYYKEYLTIGHLQPTGSMAWNAQSDAQLRNKRQACVLQPDNPACNELFLTSDIRDGLEWARTRLPKNAVFAGNVFSAGAYGAYSERQAYYETANWTPEGQSPDPTLLVSRFGPQATLLFDWVAGKPDVPARMRAAGISYLFVDRLNGFATPAYPDLPPPVFERPDFAIYRLL